MLDHGPASMAQICEMQRKRGGRELLAETITLNYADSAMSETVQLTVPMPASLAKLRFPKALDDRLHYLLDEQGRKGKLTAAEKKEAEGLTQMATTLSILKLGAQVKSRTAS